MYILIKPRLKLMMTDKINRENLCASPVQLYHSVIHVYPCMTFVKSRTQISVREEFHSVPRISSLVGNNRATDSSYINEINSSTITKSSMQIIKYICPFAKAQLLAYNYSICTRRAAFQAWIRFQRESSKVLLKKKNNNFEMYGSMIRRITSM